MGHQDNKSSGTWNPSHHDLTQEEERRGGTTKGKRLGCQLGHLPLSSTLLSLTLHWPRQPGSLERLSPGGPLLLTNSRTLLERVTQGGERHLLGAQRPQDPWQASLCLCLHTHRRFGNPTRHSDTGWAPRLRRLGREWWACTSWEQPGLSWVSTQPVNKF